eukprot:142182-Lingulodinium_polyedra.AAC.1
MMAQWGALMVRSAVPTHNDRHGLWKLDFVVASVCCGSDWRLATKWRSSFAVGLAPLPRWPVFRA